MSMRSADPDGDDLRRRAEARLNGQATSAAPQDAVETQRLLHELRVHQIELEMQNEALREARETLSVSENKYRLLSELSADCIFWSDPEGKMLYISPACRAVFGRDPEDFIADTGQLEALIHPEDRPAYRAHVAHGSSTETTVLEFRILDGDRVRWIEHCCEPMRNAAGDFLGRRSGNRDITRRKDSEDAMRRQALDLRQNNAELNAFNRLMVDRELFMIGLKMQVNALCRELGHAPPYPANGFPSDAAEIHLPFSGAWL